MSLSAPRGVYQHLQSPANREPGHQFTGNPRQQERLAEAVDTGGFGAINLTVAGPNTHVTSTQTAVVGQLYPLPRTGTLIARFTF